MQVQAREKTKTNEHDWCFDGYKYDTWHPANHVPSLCRLYSTPSDFPNWENNCLMKNTVHHFEHFINITILFIYLLQSRLSPKKQKLKTWATTMGQLRQAIIGSPPLKYERHELSNPSFWII